MARVGDAGVQRTRDIGVKLGSRGRRVGSGRHFTAARCGLVGVAGDAFWLIFVELAGRGAADGRFASVTGFVRGSLSGLLGRFLSRLLSRFVRRLFRGLVGALLVRGTFSRADSGFGFVGVLFGWLFGHLLYGCRPISGS